MKKFISASCLLIGLAGCESVTDNEPTGEPVTIEFCAFTASTLPMSRASLANACTALDYYRYTDGTLTGSKKMTSSDDGFGTFKDAIEWGTHELYFIGHRTEVTDFTDGVATFDKVSDTFTHYLSLTVDENTSTTQAFTLDRRVAKFELMATDALPDYLASADITITGGTKSVDVKTGIGGPAVVQQKTITVPASNIGKPNCTFNSYLFLPEGVTEVDIVVVTKDADGNELVEYNFEDVEVKVNCITCYKGMMFGKNPSFSLSVDNEWEETNETEF